MEAFIQKNSETLFVRLGPDADLFAGILATCAQFDITYGMISSCIGSLKQTTYTFVQANTQNISGIAYRPAITTHKPNEVISAQGTIGLTDGKPDVHMHAVMCDVEGALFAGHLMPGCLICATMEISILTAQNGRIVREFDPVLKLPLFHLTPSNN